jgi:hypothetical protein
MDESVLGFASCAVELSVIVNFEAAHSVLTVRRLISSVLAATSHAKTRQGEESAVTHSETVVDSVNRHEDLKWLLTLLTAPKYDKHYNMFISIIKSPEQQCFLLCFDYYTSN